MSSMALNRHSTSYLTFCSVLTPRLEAPRANRAGSPLGLVRQDQEVRLLHEVSVGGQSFSCF